MRIGIYNPSAGIRKSGGTETFLREMMKRLQKKHEVVLFTGKGELTKDIKKLGINVVRIPFIDKKSIVNQLAYKFPLSVILPVELESLDCINRGDRWNH